MNKKLILVFIFILFITVNCGKKGPPLPPEEKPPVTEKKSSSIKNNTVIKIKI